MRTQSFQELAQRRWSLGRFVCVGLDSDFQLIPKFAHESDSQNWVSKGATIEKFNREIIQATHDLAWGYKINIAFYEEHGIGGIAALGATIRHIRHVDPLAPIILDAKRGDVGDTNEAYARMAFDEFDVDAVTVNPYVGEEAIRPFLERRGRGIFVLCRTSNPGAREFQDLPVFVSRRSAIPLFSSRREIPLYQYVAEKVADRKGWNTNGNCGLVVGATDPEGLKAVQNIARGLPILIPGVGAQGGDIEAVVAPFRRSNGNGMIVGVSRSIIFATSGSDYAAAACHRTRRLNNLISSSL